jgi:ribosomal protein L14E/L6E/L27E
MKGEEQSTHDSDNLVESLPRTVLTSQSTSPERSPLSLLADRLVRRSLLCDSSTREPRSDPTPTPSLPVSRGMSKWIRFPALPRLTTRYPLKVTKSMGKKKVSRRSKVKPFIKVVNYAHLLPTRYVLELESLKGSVSNDTFKEPSQREDAKKAIKKAFEERYAKGSNRWCKLDIG